MYSKPKTAQEKRWLESVVDFAQESSFLNRKYGLETIDPNTFEIDHILGAQTKRKVNGVTVKVGEWAIMPMPYELHNIRSNHPFNRTTNPKRFREAFGNERDIWRDMVEKMRDLEYEIPFSDEVLQAIVKG